MFRCRSDGGFGRFLRRAFARARDTENRDVRHHRQRVIVPFEIDLDLFAIDFNVAGDDFDELALHRIDHFRCECKVIGHQHQLQPLLCRRSGIRWTEEPFEKLDHALPPKNAPRRPKNDSRASTVGAATSSPAIFAAIA